MSGPVSTTVGDHVGIPSVVLFVAVIAVQSTSEQHTSTTNDATGMYRTNVEEEEATSMQ